MSLNRIVIDRPDAKPLPYGLLSVVDAINTTDPHETYGFQYDAVCGRNVSYDVDPCTSLSASTSGGTPPTLPASLTITTDVVGTYTVNWGDGTADGTATVTWGETSKVLPHTYTTSGNKTITVTGPVGFGTQTIVVNAGTTTSYAGADPVKAEVPNAGTVYGDPVGLLAKYTCRPVGISQSEGQARAMDQLTMNESWALEKALKMRTLSGATVDVTSGTPTTPERAIALLANYAAVNYARTPVLHLDVFTASLAGNKGIVERHGDHLETTNGLLVVSGAGYSTYPVGSPTTIWVTGLVHVRRGTARAYEAMNIGPSPTNDYTWLAERSVSLGVECIVAKAQVTTT
jgi:hypothetical protein